jgi:hypothetical protein
MFTKFPEFAPFLPIHKDAYNSFIQNFEPHADLSFGNLMVWWNLTEDLAISELGGNLVLAYTNPFLDNAHCITLLGNTNIDTSIQTIFDYQRRHELKPWLHMVPNYTVDAIQRPETLHIEEDLANTDYILSSRRMAELTESTIGQMRRKVRHFLRLAEEDVEVKELSLHGIRDKIQLINAIHQWDHVYSSENDRSRYEGLAINKALLLSDLTGLRCLAVYVHRKLEAFLLFQIPPQPNFAIANHLKTSYAYKHIFDFTFHALSKKLLEEGIEYINNEQDLGLPGLRFYKEKLKPVSKLKKYDIYPA